MPRIAQAVPSARASVTVNGTVTAIPLQLSGTVWTATPTTLTTSTYIVRIDRLWLDPDPGILYDIAAQNLTSSPLHYVFNFETDIEPTSVVTTKASLQNSGGSNLAYRLFGIGASAAELPLGVDLGSTTESASSHQVLAEKIVALGGRLSFDLSASDSFSIGAKVTQVPEPSAALLCGAGLLALAFRRRHATQ